MDGVTSTGEANTNVVSQAVYYNSTYNWGGPQYGSARYELFVKENNFIKMREISLAYRLPLSSHTKSERRMFQYLYSDVTCSSFTERSKILMQNKPMQVQDGMKT